MLLAIYWVAQPQRPHEQESLGDLFIYSQCIRRVHVSFLVMKLLSRSSGTVIQNACGIFVSCLPYHIILFLQYFLDHRMYRRDII
jgi:hypothetical protein